MVDYERLTEELYTFIETHFHKNFDAKRYILHSDFIDFIWENSDFNMIKVKKILNSWRDLEVHNGKVYGLFCFTYPEINRIEDDATSSSSDEDEEEEDDEFCLTKYDDIPEIDTDEDDE
jgi:hypothetical protein